jgi:cytidylate kinase
MTEGGPAQRLPSGQWARTAPTDADLRALITDVLRSFADTGSVVIVSHAASFALAGGEVLRVLVTASEETRSRRVSETSGTDEREAARQIRTEDGARADYLKRFYGVERELPTHFDMVINTDALTREQAAGLIAAAVK